MKMAVRTPESQLHHGHSRTTNLLELSQMFEQMQTVNSKGEVQSFKRVDQTIFTFQSTSTAG